MTLIRWLCSSQARFGGILATSATAMWLLWAKIHSLLYLDPPRWMQEAFRVAHGEMPYRDFAWHFPPFSVLLYGFTLRVFGVRFSVVQILTDALSLATVLLAYRLMRYLLPGGLQFLTCLLLIVVCATTQTYFSLFSLLIYGPPLLTGALGLLLILCGAFAYLDKNALDLKIGLCLSVGSFIALLSKPEPMLATAAALLTLALFDRGRLADKTAWLKRHLLLAVICCGPAALVYVYFGAAAGWPILAASLSGFGHATVPCPWWPTGIGIWAALAGFGQAAMLVALGSLPDRVRWRRVLKSRYTGLWLAAVTGAALFIGYQWYANWGIIHGTAPLASKLSELGRIVLSTTSVFRAALWPAIGYCAYLALTGLRCGLRLKDTDLRVLLLLVVTVVMCTRSLFGTVISPYPEIPAICYPFVLLIGPYLLVRVLHAPYRPAGLEKAAPNPVRAVAVIVIAYMAVRVVGAYPGLLSDKAYTTIHTQAGDIRVREGEAEARVYRYVMENTAPSDPIVELPYGGGIGFATGRRSPLYSNQFALFMPPREIQQRDLDRIRARPPRVVIAMDAPHFGTYYGVEANVGCEFPRLVWMPNRPAGDAAYVLPVVRFISEHYRVSARFGPWLILTPAFDQPMRR